MINLKLTDLTILPSAIFKLHVGTIFVEYLWYVSKYNFNSNTAVLQCSFPSHHDLQTYENILVGTEPCKSPPNVFNEVEKNTVKMIIPSNITNHINALSV